MTGAQTAIFASKRRPGRPPVSAARIGRAAALIDSGLSLREAAKATKVPASTLSVNLKLGAAPGRKHSLSETDVDRILELRARKVELAEIAEAFGVGTATVSRAIAARVGKRSRGRPRKVSSQQA